MSKHRSATGRTVMEATLHESGDLDFTVTRDGRTVHSFSIGRESGIGAEDYIVTEGGVAVVMGDAGPDGVAVRKAAYDVSTGEQVSLPVVDVPAEELPHEQDNDNVSAATAAEPIH